MKRTLRTFPLGCPGAPGGIDAGLAVGSNRCGRRTGPGTGRLGAHPAGREDRLRHRGRPPALRVLQHQVRAGWFRHCPGQGARGRTGGRRRVQRLCFRRPSQHRAPGRSGCSHRRHFGHPRSPAVGGFHQPLLHRPDLSGGWGVLHSHDPLCHRPGRRYRRGAARDDLPELGAGKSGKQKGYRAEELAHIRQPQRHHPRPAQRHARHRADGAFDRRVGAAPTC